jgi:hypothetical protein
VLIIHMSCLIQRTTAASLTSVMRTVKVLVLSMSPPSVDDAITFVTLFSCLEKLYVLVRIIWFSFIYFIAS